MTRKASAQLDAEAARLRAEGMSYPRIARRLNIGQGTAHRCVQREVAQHRGGEPVALSRDLDLARLDSLYAVVLEIMQADHPTVSSGRIAKIDGVPIIDPRVRLLAIDRALGILDRRTKLLGTAAGHRPEFTSDMMDAEIERLTREIAALDDTSIATLTEQDPDKAMPAQDGPEAPS